MELREMKYIAQNHILTGQDLSLYVWLQHIPLH